MDIKEAMEQLRKLPVTLAIKHLGGADAIETVLNELDNKDKIINEMAEQLTGYTVFLADTDIPIILINKKEVIDYFTKKVKEGK